MAWLQYTHDEVLDFHPVFETCARAALAEDGMTARYSWRHHLRTTGSALVPDFVLTDAATGRWLLAVEVKRRPESVHSDRFQYQSKSYAEHNRDRYRPAWPAYFAITNLEETILFALNGEAPPRDCLVQGGVYTSGLLADDDEALFLTGLTASIREIVRSVVNEQHPVFDRAWPQVVARFAEAVTTLNGAGAIDEPTSPGWDPVRSTFANDPAVDAARLLALRCLLVDYLRGLLERYGHPRAGDLHPLPGGNLPGLEDQLGRVWDRVRTVDFGQLFDAGTRPSRQTLATYRAALADYFASITTAPVAMYELARDRMDQGELLPALAAAGSVGVPWDDGGKVVTDPELASLLASVVIRDRPGEVIDPCCGNAALLNAAYDRLAELGLDHEATLGHLRGIEADPLLARLGILRLLTKQPADITQTTNVDIRHADMFGTAWPTEVDYVLMNPPFRRYEDQGNRVLAPGLRAHYAEAIENIDGRPSVAVTGQQNLYTYYVEWAVKSARVGTRFGFVLDNKWYQNQYARPLRALLARECHIEAILEYPYSDLFAGWTIATSVLICTKVAELPADASTRFARCSVELARVDPNVVQESLFGTGATVNGWAVHAVPQSTLDPAKGWKNNFDATFTNDFRRSLTALGALFSYVRRGSLAKEEGGMSAMAFPFSRRTFGYRRAALGTAGRRGQNHRVRLLTADENARLADLASRVPEAFRGLAVENADVLSAYELTAEALSSQATIEPPSLRGLDIFITRRRTAWTLAHEAGVRELDANEEVARFVDAFRQTTGLDTALMPDQELWVGLREPVAGDLVIPRKMRAGHRVHINPFAGPEAVRHVRLSSNFLSLAEPICLDPPAGIDRAEAVRMIAAFLVSSFGQLQFEMIGVNREGVLSIEEHHLQSIKVLDPRRITADRRAAILAAFRALPYPISTDRLSLAQIERNALDIAIAAALRDADPTLQTEPMIEETHLLLDEYILGRRP